MCRLFGFRSIFQSQVHDGLVHAENALLRQSENHRDGWGVAYYKADAPNVVKAASTACDDTLYRRVSSLIASRTVLAHIRKATAGAPSFANTHPFQYGPWVFAHNGKIGRFDSLKTRISARIAPELRANILGETDSEYFFYLILTHLSRNTNIKTRASHLQDIAAAARSAMHEISELTGGVSRRDNQSDADTFLTFLLTDGVNMLAHQGGKDLHVHTDSPNLEGRAHSIIFASEPLQGEKNWHSLDFGTMLGVDAQLRVHAGLQDGIYPQAVAIPSRALSRAAFR